MQGIPQEATTPAGTQRQREKVILQHIQNQERHINPAIIQPARHGAAVIINQQHSSALLIHSQEVHPLRATTTGQNLHQALTGLRVPRDPPVQATGRPDPLRDLQDQLAGVAVVVE
jgi:hypothetical protein